jgi:hypothetical protein
MREAKVTDTDFLNGVEYRYRMDGRVQFSDVERLVRLGRQAIKSREALRQVRIMLRVGMPEYDPIKDVDDVIDTALREDR